MANTKKILAGIGIGVLGYIIANKVMKSRAKSGFDGDTMSPFDGNGSEIGSKIGNGVNFGDANGIEEVTGEYYNAEGDFYSAEGDFYDADGDFFGADGSVDSVKDDFYSADGEEVSNARGKAKGRKKRGKGVVAKRQLAIWQRKVKVLEKAKARAQQGIAKATQRVQKLTQRMYNRIDKKLAHARQKVAQLQQRMNAQ